MNHDPTLLTVTQVARSLHTSEAFVRGLVRDGRLAHVRLGRCVRIATAELHRFVLSASIPARRPHLHDR